VALTLSSAQMKALAQQASSTAAQAEGPAPEISERAAAIACMESIETFFLRKEPSSPIPLLLGRARSCSGKDFASLMREMLPS
jgi:type VI secretion system protein ImpA